MVQFVNITKEEFLRSKLLYKYMPLEDALRSLKENYLWFANPSVWKDPFEKRFLKAKYIKDGKEVDFTWRDRVFCTCLTQTVTSEAYWNTYRHDNIGIEFRIYREKLLEELEEYDDSFKVFIGRAEYLKTSDITKGLRDIPFDPPIGKDERLNTDFFAARLFLLKRVAFEYEDEIRIIIVKKNQTKESGIKFKYSCKNTELIHQIVLDPNLGKYTAAMLKNFIVKEYGFSPFIGKVKNISRVFQSQLYANQIAAEIRLD